jgi:carbonic anhydrase
MRNGKYTPRFRSGDTLTNLLARNRKWSTEQDPAMMEVLANQQNPKILWIGCSDSRVPETTILDLCPGDLFVHRNIGNVVSGTDMSILSVIQFAVEVVKVEHVIICGNAHSPNGGLQQVTLSAAVVMLQLAAADMGLSTIGLPISGMCEPKIWKNSKG